MAKNKEEKTNVMRVLEQKKIASALEEKQLLDKLWETYELSHEAAKALRVELESVPKASRRISELKREISALEEEHVALLTAYERTFDLATVKAAAEAAGMSKPSSGQIQYIDLSGADSVEVYAAGGAAALNGFTEKAESLWAYVLEYFR